ncbi:MAG: nucleotidyltransferase domain-containing protein [Candidatus Nanohalobium sp.]
MTSRHREAFEVFAEKAEEELGDSLKKLVLYGSVARGEESEKSDVDVFAVVKSEEEKQVLRDLAFETGLEYEVSFSPIVKTEEEYLEVKDTVYGREVRSTGEIHV